MKLDWDRFGPDDFISTFNGIYTYQCECDWERCFVFPEEYARHVMVLLDHFKDKHGVYNPL